MNTEPVLRCLALVMLFVATCTSTAETADFDSALQRLTPLARVDGSANYVQNDERLRGEPRDSRPQFAGAIDYAAATGSYALLVHHNGQLLLEHYFDSYTPDLRPESASMHKSVLGLLIGAALEDGFIDSVQQPASDFIHEWKGRPEGEITLYQLLTMTSGLQPLSREGGDDSPNQQFYQGGEKAQDLLLGMRLSETPGSHFLYANTNSQLLALILERATGLPYRDYLSLRLWQPIGAADAYVWLNKPDGMARAYSALLARPLDWLRIGLLIKQHGKWDGLALLSSETIDAMTAPSAGNVNYGWQIWLGNDHQQKRYYNDVRTGPFFVSAEPFAAHDMIYLDGFGGQRVYVSRDSELVIVRLGAPTMNWDDTALPNLVIAALVDEVSTTDSR